MVRERLAGRVARGQDAVAAEPTNPQAVALSMAIPLTVAAGCVYSALNPPWDDDDGEWAAGLLLLIPFEFVRALVISIVGDTFARWQNARQATRDLLLSLSILVGILLVGAAAKTSLHDLFAALASPATWKILLPPTAIIVADAVISVRFFGGDPQRASARMQAVADDAAQLLFLSLYPTPLLVAGAYAGLLALQSHGFAMAAWVPPAGAASLRALALYYAAGYFVLKALVVARVHTAAFNRSGVRLFGGEWVRLLLSKARERERDRAEESAKVLRRRRILAGAAPE